MKTVSCDDVATATAPTTVFAVATKISSPEREKAKEKVEIPAIGTLKIDLKVSDAESSAAAISNAYGTKSLTKKAPAKKLGARKIESGEMRIESFESIERKAQKAAEEAERQASAADSLLQPPTLGRQTSSRLASVYDEAENSFKVASPVVQTMYGSNSKSSEQTLYGSNSKSSGQSMSGSNSNSTGQTMYGSNSKSSTGGSGSAVDKYKGVKSISSDAFFGDTKESAAELKDRLSRMSGATAISSDMLSGRVEDDDAGLRNLQSTVANFFTDMTKRTLG